MKIGNIIELIEHPSFFATDFFQRGIADMSQMLDKQRQELESIDNQARQLCRDVKKLKQKLLVIFA